MTDSIAINDRINTLSSWEEANDLLVALTAEMVAIRASIDRGISDSASGGTGMRLRYNFLDWATDQISDAMLHL